MLNGEEIEGVLRFYELLDFGGEFKLRDENIGAISVVGAGRNAGVPAPPDMDLGSIPTLICWKFTLRIHHVYNVQISICYILILSI